MKKQFCVLAFLLTISSCTSTEPPKVPIVEIKSQQVPMFVETLAKDVDGVVWAMALLPDERILLTLREGQFKILNLKNKKVINVPGAPAVLAEGQGGLLDIVLDPDFKKNQYIYYTYSGIVEKASATTLARAKLLDDKLVETKILFVAKPAQTTTAHFGSRIVFDGKGHLFVSLGERTMRDLAQDLSTHMGKVIRLNIDGSVPDDNPFIKTKNALPEIWSYGHRNPQGMYYDFESNELWLNEHGPRGGDEINLVLKGKNYAWPLATYGREYYGPKVSEHATLKGTENPRHVWLPSIAPSDLVRYKGQAFPAWKGSFLSGSLVLEHLNRVEFKKGKSIKEERYLVDLEERVRSIVLDKRGNIILGTDSGAILKLSPLTR